MGKNGFIQNLVYNGPLRFRALDELETVIPIPCR